jgi:hypothetical protein
MILRPCPACGQHVQRAALACPHCGAIRGGKLSRSAAAVVMGLTLIGADDPGQSPEAEPPPPEEDPAPIIAEAIYGVSATRTRRRIHLRDPRPADPNSEADDDHDGVTPRAGDCDDADPDVFPGAPERRFDGVDSDCDGKNNR